MKTFLDCWVQVATDLFAQALAGEPKLNESLPRPFRSGSFGFAATIAGDLEGTFSILVDGAALEAPLLGEGADQKAGWSEVVRETLNAAAGEMLAKSGVTCAVEKFEEIAAESKVTRAFELRSGDHVFAVLVRDDLRAARAAVPAAKPAPAATSLPAPALSPGLELLLDVELEASLRFGSREMPLGEILDLGPGDVVQLDRHVSDPVDLIVGDKIVARGEVVLVNGNFGLRVTDVAAPQRRLESIRCLF
jgi:flagellar motor switch protein FliN/FliY